MGLKLAAINLMPKSTLFSMVQKDFTKRAGFEVTHARIFIQYLKNEFTIKVWNSKKWTEKTKPVTEFTDISSILLSKVKKLVKAKEINIIDLEIDFAGLSSKSIIYYLSEINELDKFETNDVF